MMDISRSVKRTRPSGEMDSIPSNTWHRSLTRLAGGASSTLEPGREEPEERGNVELGGYVAPVQYGGGMGRGSARVAGPGEMGAQKLLSEEPDGDAVAGDATNMGDRGAQRWDRVADAADSDQWSQAGGSENRVDGVRKGRVDNSGRLG